MEFSFGRVYEARHCGRRSCSTRDTVGALPAQVAWRSRPWLQELMVQTFRKWVRELQTAWVAQRARPWVRELMVKTSRKWVWERCSL